jgi:hypothetical protein
MSIAQTETAVTSYREAAPEAHADPEVTLLRCDVEVRHGVSFGVVVTDRSFMYLRPVSFWSSASAWAVVPLERVRDVALSARSPWPLRALGVCFLAVLASVLYVASSGAVTTLDVRALAIPAVAAVACFVSARSRLVLSWRDGDRVQRLGQPPSFDRFHREGMSGALREAARLLSDPTARRTATDRARARAAANAPVG